MPGLYVHIPFCLKKCHYCDFVITVDRAPDMKERFFHALEIEILESVRLYGKLKFETLYLGGGTPSALDAREMERLTELLRKVFQFQTGYEFTCEANPGDVDAEKLAAYRDLGINRISLGAQSFNDEILKRIGRTHNARQTVETVKLLQRTGFQNISMDLMLRLPGQSVGDVDQALKETVALGPGQISIYDLDVHHETAFGRMQQKGKLKLPDEEIHARMFECVEDHLAAAGYSQYELTNFARPGFESNHNMIYWKNGEYLGLGPGAFSYMKGVRYQFAAEVKRYLEKCERGDWPRDSEEVLSEEKKEIETVITGIRLKQGIRSGDFPMIRGRLEPQIAKLLKAGLLESQGDRTVLSRRGRYLAETVFAELIQ